LVYCLPNPSQVHLGLCPFPFFNPKLIYIYSIKKKQRKTNEINRRKKQWDIRRHDERDKTNNNNTQNQKAKKKKQREKEPWNKWPSHPLNLPLSQHQKTHL